MLFRNSKNEIKVHPSAKERRRQGSFGYKIIKFVKNFLNKKAFFVVVLILIIYLLVGNLSANFESKIKSIEINGNSRIRSEDLENFFKDYKEFGIITFNATKVKNEILKTFQEVRDVNIVKEYPDRIIVEIVEKNPTIVFFDFDSIELFDSDGSVVGKLEPKKIMISKEDAEIYQNGGDPNANYVRLRMQSETVGAFVWDKVTNEDRVNTLKKINEEIRVKVDTYINETTTFIKNGIYGDLVIVYYVGFEDKVFSNERTIGFLVNLREILKNEKIELLRSSILNIFDLKIESNQGKSFLFSIRRSLDDQINDLRSVLRTNRIDNGTIFDFRSVNFSIR